MEVLRGRRRIGDDEVVLGAELEVALQPRARVLRPLPLIAMGQEEHESRVLAPLCAISREELVDDGLSNVREIAELCLPEHQVARSRRAAAVLEADDPALRPRTVVDVEAAARVGRL